MGVLGANLTGFDLFGLAFPLDFLPNRKKLEGGKARVGSVRASRGSAASTRRVACRDWASLGYPPSGQAALPISDLGRDWASLGYPPSGQTAHLSSAGPTTNVIK